MRTRRSFTLCGQRKTLSLPTTDRRNYVLVEASRGTSGGPASCQPEVRGNRRARERAGLHILTCTASILNAVVRPLASLPHCGAGLSPGSVGSSPSGLLGRGEGNTVLSGDLSGLLFMGRRCLLTGSFAQEGLPSPPGSPPRDEGNRTGLEGLWAMPTPSEISPKGPDDRGWTHMARFLLPLTWRASVGTLKL